MILNTHSTVEHDCIIEEGVHIGPGAQVAGGVSISNGVWIGIGAVISDHVHIGEGSIVGAGAVVIEDVPANVIVIGVPARILKEARHIAAK